jgi:hypothetical protein
VRTRRSLTAGTTRRIDKQREYVERGEAERAELLATSRYRVEPACRADLFTKLSFAAHRGELTLSVMERHSVVRAGHFLGHVENALSPAAAAQQSPPPPPSSWPAR